MSEPIPCKLITWDDCDQLSRSLAQRLQQENVRIDMIVAIGRGGYMPARILSDVLGQQNLTSFKIEHYQGPHKDAQATVKYGLSAPVDHQHILLVDDVSDSGDTFTVAIDYLNSLGIPASISTAVLHHKVVSKYEPDFYAERVEQWVWITYPWALVEDISTFIAAMATVPDEIDAIAEILFQRHGIKVDELHIQDALNLLARQGQSGGKYD